MSIKQGNMEQNQIYYDSITFWARMGVQNEDNLIALATIDVLNIYKDGARVIPYYVELGNRLLAKIASPIYENRGKDGFLDGKGF